MYRQKTNIINHNCLIWFEEKSNFYISQFNIKDRAQRHKVNEFLNLEKIQLNLPRNIFIMGFQRNLQKKGMQENKYNMETKFQISNQNKKYIYIYISVFVWPGSKAKIQRFISRFWKIDSEACYKQVLLKRWEMD